MRATWPSSLSPIRICRLICMDLCAAYSRCLRGRAHRLPASRSSHRRKLRSRGAAGHSAQQGDATATGAPPAATVYNPTHSGPIGRRHADRAAICCPVAGPRNRNGLARLRRPTRRQSHLQDVPVPPVPTPPAKIFLKGHFRSARANTTLPRWRGFAPASRRTSPRAATLRLLVPSAPT